MRTHLTIGREFDVRRIGYGAMALTGLGGWGPPSDPGAARRLLRRAAELGVQLFDTADSYGPDISEELIAGALRPYSPDLLLATKGGSIREGPWRLRSDGRPEHLRTACEASLRRLRVDRIDLYQLHVVDPAVPLEDSVGALADLQSAGKIGHIGLSNVGVEQIDAARRVTPIVSVQNEYSLAARGAQDPIVDYCEREGLAYLPWQPLAKGSLARPHGSLGAVAERHGVTPAEVALAWLLARSPTIVPIPGTLSPDHLERNVASLTLALTVDDLAELDSYEPSRFDARILARRFVPPPMRRVVASVIGARRRLGSG